MNPRAVTLGLAALIAAVMVVSILYSPGTDRLSAVPAHAHIVYNRESADGFPVFGSRELWQAQNFPDIGKNEGKSFQTLETGVEPAPRSAVPQRRWFQTLEKKPLIVATVPFGGRTRRDAWVAVSELGGPAATALRWRLMLFPPAGITPARPYAVWPVWQFDDPSLPGWATVRFSITEELLVCAISTDSHDIYRLLNTADGRTASKK